MASEEDRQWKEAKRAQPLPALSDPPRRTVSLVTEEYHGLLKELHDAVDKLEERLLSVLGPELELDKVKSEGAEQAAITLVDMLDEQNRTLRSAIRRVNALHTRVLV